ncbi:MAG: isochorismate synthase [Burkholderiales bacterium]|jgi:menaquinone-specific isochorismate synthase|nr:isochorismate synthase [Burkholderiales bacterium]
MSRSIYSKKRLNLTNPLAFWRHFDGKERVFFYDPLSKKTILGAKRMKVFSASDSFQDYEYAFSARAFFDSVQDEKWTGFGNETIAFQYYFVQENDTGTLYFAGDAPEIKDAKINGRQHACLHHDPGYESWKTLFFLMRDAMASHEVEKVVISREVLIKCDSPVRVESVIKNLLEKNDSSFTFAWHKDGKTFLGSTPEILAQKKGDIITSYALAGTIPRSSLNDDLQKPRFLHDTKNLHEHQIVLDAIAGIMREYGKDVTIGETSVLTLKNLHHLITPIRSNAEASTLLEWVTRLHPTPAMGGHPADKALALIRKHESHERGLYAAPIGMMDKNGDGVFVVGIRSALVVGDTVYAYVGCGLVDESECDSEYMESTNKLKTIRESLIKER